MRSIKRAARSPAAWVWLASALLLAGCEDGTPQQATPIQPGNLTQITSADGSSVSFNETGAAYGGPPGAVTIGSTAAPQESAQCSPDGRYVTGNTIYLDFAEQAVNQEIDQVKRTLDEVTSRIEQCRGKSKGLPEYDAQFGCDRARFRQLQARLSDLKTYKFDTWVRTYSLPEELAAARSTAYSAGQKARLRFDKADYQRKQQVLLNADGTVKSKDNDSESEIEKAARKYLIATEWQQADAALKAASAAWEQVERAVRQAEAEQAAKHAQAVQAARQANEAEKRSIQAQLDQMTIICEQAESAYEQNPCNTAQLASDAFARNRAQQKLAALEARRSLLKDCRKDRERQAGVGSGMGSPAAQELLRQTLPGIIGGFGPRKPPPHQPPKDTTRQPEQPKTPPQPHWHDEKKH